MIGHLAIVYEQLPARHGVNVVFRDGTSSYDTGIHDPVFCRVGARRAHNVYGTDNELPKEGELGCVLELDGGFLLWVCSLDFQDSNQIDPDVMAMRRFDSGTLKRMWVNGDQEYLHPSGLRLTISKDGKAFPEPKRKGTPKAFTAAVPTVQLDHPTMGTLTLNADGSVLLNHSSGGTLTITKDGEMRFENWAKMLFQTALKRFVMEPLYDWAKTHTHSGVQSGGATSGPPQVPPPTNSLSPDTFKGPV